MSISSPAIHPSSRFRLFWSGLVLLGTLWYAILVPLQFALGLDPHGVMAVIDFSWTIFFLVDMTLNFHWAFYEDGEIISDPKRIRERYFQRGFRYDFPASLPLDWVLLVLFSSSPETIAWVRLVRLLKLVRLVRLQRMVANMSAKGRGLLVTDVLLNASSRVRLALLFLWSVLGLNAISCIWILIQPSAPVDQTLLDVYIRAVYWAVTTLATVGYGDITPSTNAGRVFASVVMLVGVGVYGLAIGNISTLIVNANAHRIRQREKLANLANFMAQYQIPLGLQNDIFSFYSHYLANRASSNNEILNELPPELQERIGSFINIFMIRQVPFFKDADHPCLEDISKCLTSKILVPKDVIIRAGEVGREMYFLSHGVVEVLTPEGKPVVKLRAGSFFGEVAVLKDTPRSATIQAITYCDVFVLSQDDLKRVLASHPDLQRSLDQTLRERFGHA
ncbi:MAG: ion transporter [Magnetococcales bacterium]|nr:ion transporter [Magnetococcales bacterium]MBF0156241.1 ion transporter [Magnetococcales bacterium]